MRFEVALSLALVAGTSLVLASCGKPAPSAAPAATPQAAADGHTPTVAELQASAAADEAEADRLLKQAQGGAAPAAATAASANDQSTLAEGDEKLHSGQFYDTIEIDAQAGETFHVTYDTTGYQPVVIILGPDNKPDSQAVGPAPDAQGHGHIESDTTANRTGKWHALLSAFAPGAGGAYRVSVSRDH